MKACLHLYFIIRLNSYAEKYLGFKMQMFDGDWLCGDDLWLQPYLFRSLPGRVTCFHSFQITQKLAWRSHHFLILLTAKGNPWLLG